MDSRERKDDWTETIRTALDGRQASIWTSLPGIIESVDLTRMTARVQPAIKGVRQLPDGSFQPINLPLLVDCPIKFPNGGGYVLTFPISPGDECEVSFSSRCIDAWWASGGIQPQAEFRMHDLSDGFVEVGPRSQPRVIPNISETTTQLRTESGDTYIEITTSGEVNIKAPVKVTVDSPTAHFTGNVTVAGNVDVDGTVHGKTNVLFGPDSISGKDHVHTNVQNGPNNTGGPQ